MWEHQNIENYIKSSNRTFMELKSASDKDEIVHEQGSNRTFMELK